MYTHLWPLSSCVPSQVKRLTAEDMRAASSGWPPSAVYTGDAPRNVLRRPPPPNGTSCPPSRLGRCHRPLAAVRVVGTPTGDRNSHWGRSVSRCRALGCGGVGVRCIHCDAALERVKKVMFCKRGREKRSGVGAKVEGQEDGKKK